MKHRVFENLVIVGLMLGASVSSSEGAVIFVTTAEQKISDSGGCSLQEAIYSANFDNNIAIDGTNSDGTDHFLSRDGQLAHTQCVPGSGDDVIVLPLAATLEMRGAVEDAYNPTGPTATPIIFSKITIEGFGARLVWVNPATFARAFTVGTAAIPLPDGTTASGTGVLTIRNVHVQGFIAKGGDGADGGGGGLGAGGAIYVNGGFEGNATLVVKESAFEGNGAIGGNGSQGFRDGSQAFREGGGGGGMGGNGGSGFSLAGGGGGGGGSRGRGGDSHGFSGGHGGGTVLIPRCGGEGGNFGDDGSDASCAGGGGGGGGVPDVIFSIVFGAQGGNGSFGGGGGGGGSDGIVGRDGGNGGFGGGGGACAGNGALGGSLSGGKGGFGGGGGACLAGGGDAGRFGGAGVSQFGGGGGALGGAIYNDEGTVIVENSTFTGNFVARGAGGASPGGAKGQNGADAGAAVYSRSGSLTVRNSTISGNESTGPLGGVIFDNRSFPCSGTCVGPPAAFFTLHNTIIAHNGGAFSSPKECGVLGRSEEVLTVVGSGNLIMQNDTDSPCPGVVSSDDPQLGPLQSPAPTPTMAIPQSSPAWNAADPTTSLAMDQRGETRPQMGGFDIGAFELCLDRFLNPCLISAGAVDTRSLTVQASLLTGGTTIPAPGTYSEPLNSVIVLAAKPDPNYCFVDWTGPAVVPTSAVTTVVMDQARTVTANIARVVSTTVATPVLNVRNHTVVNVGLNASGNCGSPTAFQVTVFGNEEDETPTDGRTVFSPDATNIGVGTLRLRAERVDAGDGRVYLLVVRGTDAAGNTGFACNTVVVPHDSSAASMASVNAHAAAARAYCESHDGAEPPGYFVIGDGPIIGSKQ